MDLSSYAKADFLRPTLTLLVPGATAVLPYLIRLRTEIPVLSQYLEDHRSAAVVAIAIGFLTAGLLLEILGGLIETLWLDRRLTKKYPPFIKDWYKYLSKAYQDNTPGHHYVNSVTLHLQFELAMAPALVLSFCGFVWLNKSATIVATGDMRIVGAGTALIVAYLIYDAFVNAHVLAKLRCALISEYGAAMAAALGEKD